MGLENTKCGGKVHVAGSLHSRVEHSVDRLKQDGDISQHPGTCLKDNPDSPATRHAFANCPGSFLFAVTVKLLACGSTCGVSDDDHTVRTSMSMSWYAGSSMLLARQFIANW
jgi:hypothetical protein